MRTYHFEPIEKSPRIGKLIDDLYAKMPEVEADRAALITESYQKTQGMPVVARRAQAFCHILAPRTPGLPGVPGVLLRVAAGRAGYH